MLEHTAFNQRTLEIEGGIYDEALSGSSWYEAGVRAGLEGDHLKVTASAIRLARTYAKLYRQEWPLDEVDARDGRAALDLALEGLDWDAVAERLRYASSTQAEVHARVAADQVGLDCARLDRIRLGRVAYEMRLATSNWKEIAAELHTSENTTRAAAEDFAKATRRPWPLRYKPPPWGQIAYERREQTQESWKVIASDLGLDWEYLSKEARGYAVANGRPWPMPASPRLYRDTGAEAYRLRSEERLSWEAISRKLDVSRGWALRSAQRHVNDTGAPWPIRMPEASSVEEEAYSLRKQGHGWVDVAEMMGCSLGVAQDRARRFADRAGRPWPINVPPVRRMFSARAKEAYERGYVEKESWHQIAGELGYASGQACQNSARVFAERFGLHLRIRRRGKITRDPDRPREAYEARASDPTASWDKIGKALGYKAWRSAYTAAKNWATGQGLPWPPGDAKGSDE